MADQYLRYCSLTVYGAGGGIDLSAMRIKFKITHTTTQAPNTLIAFIYNLSKETRERIMTQKEFTRIVLDAGYEQNHGVIFDGEIVQRVAGRENPTDTYLAIIAKDGDKPYNHAVVNKTLAKGATGRDQFDALFQAMQPLGVNLGFVSEKIAQIKFPRAVSMFGMARDYLRNLALSTGCTWSIQYGKLDMVHKDEAKPGGAIVLNSQTGLVGMPIETMNGIMVRCLINPRLADKVNCYVKIDQASINRSFVDTSYAADAFQREYLGNKTLGQVLGTSDGVYKVVAVDWVGDTRGGEWYADFTCFGAKTGAPTPQMTSDLPNLGPS